MTWMTAMAAGEFTKL